MEAETNQTRDPIMGLAKYGGAVATLGLLAAGTFIVRDGMGRSVFTLMLVIPLLALIGPQLMVAVMLGMPESFASIAALSVVYYPLLLLPLGMRWTIGIDRGRAVRWQALLVFVHLAVSAGSLVWIGSSITM